MFRGIKLWFTNKPYYHQRKRYMKLQKTYRAKLQKQAKEFCPWSGWYIHEMVKTMLEFYEKTYTAQDCCWTTEEHTNKVAEQVRIALDFSAKLDMIDDVDSCDELIPFAKEYSEEFSAYCDEVNKRLEDETYAKRFPGYVAYEFLEKKYTSELYNTIGKYIWGWYD